MSKMKETAFCENGDCRVVTFETMWLEDETQNCPGCGQFGRTKNRNEDKHAEHHGEGSPAARGKLSAVDD